VHRNHLSNANRRPAAFNFDRDVIGDPEPIGRHIICRLDGNSAALMQAANEGAQAARSEGVRSLEIRVHLPFEQEVNPFVEQAFEHATFLEDRWTAGGEALTLVYVSSWHYPAVSRCPRSGRILEGKRTTLRLEI
jgi:hypothetical protein